MVIIFIYAWDQESKTVRLWGHVLEGGGLGLFLKYEQQFGKMSLGGFVCFGGCTGTNQVGSFHVIKDWWMMGRNWTGVNCGELPYSRKEKVKD